MSTAETVETPEQETSDPAPNEPETPTDEPDEPESAVEAADSAIEGTDADEAAGQPDDQFEEPQAPPMSEKDVEKINARLEAERARHSKRVYEITGAEPGFLLHCPLCEPEIPGYLLPREIEEERKQAVRYLLGDKQPKQLRPDQYSHVCEKCDGEGVVDTGSRVDGQKELACLECGGKGWTPIGNERRAGYIPPALGAATPENGGGEVVQLPTSDPPEVAALKAAGYVVISPIPPAQP